MSDKEANNPNGLLGQTGTTIAGEYSNKTSTADPFSFSHVGTLLAAIEEHFFTTCLLFTFIGYIVLASTGNLDSCYEFKQYLLFLLFLFLLKMLREIITYFKGKFSDNKLTGKPTK